MFFFQPPVFVRCSGEVRYNVKITDDNEQQKRRQRNTLVGQVIITTSSNYAPVILPYGISVIISVSTVNKKNIESNLTGPNQSTITVIVTPSPTGIGYKHRSCIAKVRNIIQKLFERNMY